MTRGASASATSAGPKKARQTSLPVARIVAPLVSLVLLLTLWEVGVRIANVDPTLWTPPSQVVKALPRVVGNGSYWDAIRETLELLAVGFAVSAVAGVAIGLIVGRVRILDRALTPWINGVYSTPLPAIYPIITAAVGFGFSAKVMIVFALAVFPIMMNTYQGVTETDPQLIEVARSFRASERQVWTNVLIPFATPFILVGLRLGAARALIGTVVAEFFTSPGGLGYEIIIYSYRFDISATMVIVLTLTFMGLTLVGLVRSTERVVVPWKTRD